jgi:Flp pilus assembly protein TadG
MPGGDDSRQADLTAAGLRPIRFYGQQFVCGTPVEFLDKGKLAARLGRKAMGLESEIARLPKGTVRVSPSLVLVGTRPGRAIMFRNSRRKRIRAGTTAVELAFILPVFLSIVFSVIEYGHAQMVANLLKCACRNAARVGSTEGATTAETQAIVVQYLQAAIDTSTLNVMVKNAGVWDSSSTPPTSAEAINALPNIELSSADPAQLFLVRATINYSNVSLLSMPFLQNVTLSGQAFMRHE